MTGGRRPWHDLGLVLAAASGLAASPLATGADHVDTTVTVRRARRGTPPPVVPSPILPGAPVPWSGSPLLTPPDLSVVDGRTRFLTNGPAQDRCPGDHVIFVVGVVNPFRPTVPGDGAFMCHADALIEGFVGQ